MHSQESSNLSLEEVSHQLYSSPNTYVQWEIFRLDISPDGESIIAFGGRKIQLWHTGDSTPSLSVVPTQPSQEHKRFFIVEFSPDETLAAVTRMQGKKVTVLDLKSGIPQLTIDTGMMVYGVGVGESTIVVVGDHEIVTWNLPTGDHILNLTANLNDSIKTIKFSLDPSPHFTRAIPRWLNTSVSPDLHQIAITESVIGSVDTRFMKLIDVTTGQDLWTVHTNSGGIPWFTRDGCEVWHVTTPDKVTKHKVGTSGTFDIIKLKDLWSASYLPGRPPWQPSCGYKITDDGWILHSSGKQLLWLPPHWQPSEHWHRMWGSQFLALLHDELPDVVILELE